MDIPLNARVMCSDGAAGHTADILVNPDTREVTHVVVRTAGIFGYDVVLPIDAVTKTTPEEVRVRLLRRELAALPPFEENDAVELTPEFVGFMGDALLLDPYAEVLAPTHKNIPPGEVAVRRGDRVAATDGKIGHVDGFLTDPRTNRITHLMLREGHLWGARDITIPVEEIARIDDAAVLLKLDKAQVGALPSVRMRWRAV
jgi:sporulation protein YlmC with PRC-barrel domain